LLNFQEEKISVRRQLYESEEVDELVERFIGGRTDVDDALMGGRQLYGRFRLKSSSTKISGTTEYKHRLLFNWIPLGEVRLSPLVTSATVWPLVPAPDDI
jgi:hypothetical protein